MPATVTVGAPASLDEVWRELEGSVRPGLRLVRGDGEAPTTTPTADPHALGVRANDKPPREGPGPVSGEVT